MSKSINYLLEQAFTNNGERLAFSDYEGRDFSYNDVAIHLSTIHAFLHKTGIKKGDKVILLGRNSSRWAISYIALLSYGAVIVPVLPDFKPKDFLYIIDHSDAVLLMIDPAIHQSIYAEKSDCTRPAISLRDFSHLSDPEKSPIDINNSKINHDQINLKFDQIDDDELGLLSYTSGTTGFSKGVMLSRKNLLSNILFAQEHMPLKSGHKICSFLPMAHIYGQLFEFIFPFTLGCHITFLNKMPSPTVLIKAFKEIQPDLILSVPLILEKIYKNKLLPVIQTPMMKIPLAIPGVKSIIHHKIKEQLSQNFGEHFFEMVIGGAALNKDVEDFLTKIHFRFTVGYGMTECAPLISYAGWKDTRKRSAGKIVDRMDVRIDSTDPYGETGEIQVKGDNVMMGYYKDKKATKAAFTEDGWLHTGDLGIIDEDKYIYIKGRSKNMILGANGKNIYPEEIETQINTFSLVQESVVIQEDKRLIALVYPDPLALKNNKIPTEELEDAFSSIRQKLNANLPKYMQVHEIRLSDSEFEKTPKKNIKRFVYT